MPGTLAPPGRPVNEASDRLDDHRHALADAHAERGEAVLASARLQRVREMAEDARSAPARRGVAPPRRVLVAEDGMREENGGDGTALIRPLAQRRSCGSSSSRRSVHGRVTSRVTWTRFLAVSSPLVRLRYRVKRLAGTGWHCEGRRVRSRHAPLPAASGVSRYAPAHDRRNQREREGDHLEAGAGILSTSELSISASLRKRGSPWRGAQRGSTRSSPGDRYAGTARSCRMIAIARSASPSRAAINPCSISGQTPYRASFESGRSSTARCDSRSASSRRPRLAYASARRLRCEAFFGYARTSDSRRGSAAWYSLRACAASPSASCAIARSSALG